MAGGMGGGGGGGSAGGAAAIGLVFLAPNDGLRTTQAQVNLSVGLSGNDGGLRPPAQLAYRALRGDGGVLATGALTTSNDGGSYGNALSLDVDDTYALFASLTDGGGTVGPRRVTLDRTGPVVSLQVLAAPTRASGADFVGEDPQLVGAWHRDEEAVVRLSSASSDVVDSGFTLQVAGRLADGGATAFGSSGIRVLAAATCGACAETSCRCYGVDLAGPTFSTFRGTLPLVATAADDLGNVASADAGIAVTRWRWARTVPDAGAGPTVASIGPGGVLYVGSPTGVHALFADGGTRWSSDVGAVTGTAATVDDAGVALVFYASTRGGNGELGAVLASSGAGQAACPMLGTTSTGGVVVLDTDVAGSGKRSAATVLSGGAPVVMAVRPGDATACVNATVTESLVTSAAPVCAGPDVFWPSAGSINGSSISTGAWVAATGYPVVVAGATINALAMTPSAAPTVLASTSTSLAARLAADGSVVFDATSTSGLTGVAVAANGFFFAGREDGSLVRFDAAGAASGSLALAGVVAGTPVLASDARLYAATSAGVLAVTNRSLAAEWVVSGLGAFSGSPVLDCNREHTGKGAVLYLGTSTGQVVAVVVDSTQLDATAPWPMGGHDPRRTGNLSTSTSELVCQ